MVDGSTEVHWRNKSPETLEIEVTVEKISWTEFKLKVDCSENIRRN